MIDKAKQGRSNKRKGKVAERDVANVFKKRWPNYCRHARRGLQSRDGKDAADVEGVPGLWLEVKFGKKHSPRGALEQATEDSNGARIPVAVIRDTGKEPFVVLTLDNFLDTLDWDPWRHLDAQLKKGS